MAASKKKKKEVKYIPAANVKKEVRVKDQEENYAKLNPCWSFWRSKNETLWRFCPEQLGSHDDPRSVIAALMNFEKMTWQDVKQQTHGYAGKSSSHYIDDFDKLNKSARERLEGLGIDAIFSLRISGTERIFGVLEKNVFEILWFDANHEVYPVDRD